MSVLRGLEGVKRKEIKAHFARSQADAISIIQKHRGLSAAGCEGGIVVYRDDAGDIRVQFNQYQQTINAATFKTVAELRRWLKEWWPKMGDRNKLAAMF